MGLLVDWVCVPAVTLADGGSASCCRCGGEGVPLSTSIHSGYRFQRGLFFREGLDWNDEGLIWFYFWLKLLVVTAGDPRQMPLNLLEGFDE